MGQRIIFHVSIAVLCLMFLGFGTSVHAGNEHIFGVINITITGSGHKSKSGGGDRHTPKWENSYEHSMRVGGRITVCGDGGELKVLDYAPYGTEQWMKKYAREEDHVICPPTKEQMKHNFLYRTKHYPPNIKKPGNSERGIEKFNASINYGNCLFIIQKIPRVVVYLEKGKIFQLEVSGEVEMYTWSKSETIKHYPCENKDVKDVSKYAPDMPSNAFSSEDGGSYISGPSAPEVRPLFFTAEKIGLQGSKTVYERIDKKNGYRETCIANWQFKAVELCDQVMEQLRKSMALLAAYNDVTLLNSGLDSDAYEKAIDKLAGKIYAQSGGSGQGKGKEEEYEATTDLGVDENCEVVGEDAFRAASQNACVPDIIVDATIAHEMTHTGQCNNNKALYARGFHDPLIKSKFEIEAYCTEINMLLNWLEDNCENDLSEYRDMVNAICQ